MTYKIGLVGKPPSDLRPDEDREPSVRSPSVGKSTFSVPPFAGHVRL
jgi:hypothetical protein